MRAQCRQLAEINRFLDTARVRKIEYVINNRYMYIFIWLSRRSCVTKGERTIFFMPKVKTVDFFRRTTLKE